MSSEEPDDKYETFVAGVLKDFDGRVQAIQTSAEVNMKGTEGSTTQIMFQLKNSTTQLMRVTALS